MMKVEYAMEELWLMNVTRQPPYGTIIYCVAMAQIMADRDGWWPHEKFVGESVAMA